ncbi:hypothetical protein A11A3_04700 [Alcanivorax hongdengensis A-11-3]|uniref:Uncharacterized protein n=2 Tax=Alcanivorax hongdengensis TaxID=519051 RepID=L0WHD1_9GAMM|nr:hypothetical protein A11A3_04700 [Alcanivorax hongdengensis A-11-3]
MAGLVLLMTTAAWAHGPEASAVKVRLDPLPAPMADIQVQVQTTVAPQLVVANHGKAPLTVLDEQGRAFVRIARDGVYADVRSPAWYRTQSAARGVPLPQGVSQTASAHWVKVQREPHWGWFDPRLRTEGVTVPHAVKDAGQPASIAGWSVPVRVGDTETRLQGQFRYEPLPRGVMFSRLTSAAQPLEGVTVSLAPGTVPALLVENRRDQPLLVMDGQGMPYLRIGPQGSFVNAREASQRNDLVPPRWVKVADVPRYTWTEPRAAHASRYPPSAVVRQGRRAVLDHWQIPVTLAGKTVPISGVVYWQPERGESVARAGHAHHSH